MKIFADLHIHGPYSMATSRSTTLQNLEKYARIKGLNLLGTGDFTHPTWLQMLKNDLKEDGSGILKTESGFSFMLTTEVSNVYEQDGKTRKVHNVIHAPDFETVAQINEFLGKHGNLIIDGRPTFSRMTCPEMVEGLMGISPDIVIIPAHAWTPWFGVFGSKSGFDSMEECFKDQTKHIFALETGLSSDPDMNWRLSSLDKYAFVSNSDAHSFWPWRIGREANVFELGKVTFDGI
ncbi:DNA helicase UvrD, partial [bacterium]|nr:DNA helicase UvrD [bacterium]